MLCPPQSLQCHFIISLRSFIRKHNNSAANGKANIFFTKVAKVYVYIYAKFQKF